MLAGRRDHPHGVVGERLAAAPRDRVVVRAAVNDEIVVGWFDDRRVPACSVAKSGGEAPGATSNVMRSPVSSTSSVDAEAVHGAPSASPVASTVTVPVRGAGASPSTSCSRNAPAQV
jgi:hypothetical protein